MSYNMKEIYGIIDCCLKKLRRFDKDLLDININERTITHILAEYLQEHFSDLNVDCEYNRFTVDDSEDLVKKLNLPKDQINWDDIEAKTIFPDIIIHKRRRQDSNILVIEVKKKQSSNLTSEIKDINKLKAFTTNPYNYNLGLFLKIDMEGIDDDFQWYTNREKINFNSKFNI